MAAYDERTVDWGQSGRLTYYSVRTVDPFTLAETSNDIEVDDEGTSITYAYETDNHMEATVSLLEGDYHNILETNSPYAFDGMVRIYQNVQIGSFVQSYSMGTFFVSNVSTSSLYGQSTRRLTCYGPMWAFTQDVLAQDFVRHSGDNCWDAMTDIVDYDNGHIRAGDGFDTNRGHTVDVWFPVGANRAEALNVYAGWLNAEVVSDMDGFIQVRPYRAPADRDVVYTFDQGNSCIYKAGIEWETNRDEPINRVVAYFSRESKQDDDPYPLADSCYVDLDDSADWSYRRTGRRRTEVLQISDPCSHEDLVAQAQRYLDSSAGAQLYITIEHAGVPWLRVGDCVQYYNTTDMDTVVNNKCLITEMRINSLSPMCMTQTKMRVIS